MLAISILCLFCFPVLSLLVAFSDRNNHESRLVIGNYSVIYGSCLFI